MARRRLLGIGIGDFDRETNEIRFTATVKDGLPRSFEMDLGAAAQIIGALGRLYKEAQAVAVASSAVTLGSAEEVASSNIHQEPWTGNIILQLTTPTGIPYTFAMPPQVAADIADQLIKESARPHRSGRA